MDFVFDNLPRIKEFSLATIGRDGQPWVVALNLCYDENLTIIWHSRRDTEHSQHIEQNPNVAICIYDDFDDIGDFGFYAKAHAREVTDPAELAKLLKVRFESKGKPVPPIEDYSGKSPDRIYTATLREAWVNDQSKAKRKLDLTRLFGR